jgi:hypothetical protein
MRRSTRKNGNKAEVINWTQKAEDNRKGAFRCTRGQEQTEWS